MNAPNQLDQALKALRQEHRSIAPPPSLEASILQQAPHNNTVRNWSLALATAAALAIAITLLYPRPSRPAIETHITTAPPPHTALAPSAPNITPAVTSTALPTRRLAGSRPLSTAPRHNSPALDAGAFIPLPNGVGLPEPTQAMIIRTRIDTSSLRSYGLTPPPPGAPQTILAEFLVGEDGLPRAVRLVP
jgi:hypothetical protein